MIVLGVESSCDETGLALYDTERGLLSHALHSQVAMHEEYGGVVPELASRDHIRRALPLLEQTLKDAGIAKGDIDAIAYTQGPGLAGALLVGSSVACSLALALDKPVLGVHHLEGHLLSPLLATDRPAFPFIALLVSGGHTQLMRVDGVGRYTLLAKPWTTPPAKPSTNRPSCSVSVIRAGRRFRAWRNSAIRAPTRCRARCCTRKISISASRA